MSLLSLTGALDLYQKGLFKGQYKQFWFWFDEQTCCLKYYKNQETYLHSVHEPLGFIDLRYAKVTPGLTAAKEDQASNVFHIEVDNQVTVLAAGDNNSAIKWIEKLQEKRGEFIKASLAAKPDKHRTLPVSTKRTLQVNDLKSSPISGRKTLGSFARLGDRTSRSVKKSILLEELEPANKKSTMKRSATVAYTLDPNSHLHTELMSSADAATLKDIAKHQDVIPLKDRAKLEARLLESQNEIVNLKKDILHLTEQLQKKDNEILELNKEIDILKEELILRNVPQSNLQMENESLKNIIDQYKRSVKSLDGEIELHKLSQGALDKQIQKETLALEEQIQKEGQKMIKLEEELRCTKGKYVRILSDQFKVALPGIRGHRNEGDSVNDKYNMELLAMLKQESKDNPEFETYCSSFEDLYGDQYDWDEDTVTQHYLCWMLDSYYNQQRQDKLLQDWDDYLSQLKQLQGENKGVYQLGSSNSDRLKLRNLLRRGLPLEFRTHVWSSLVNQSIGKLKEARDRAAPDDISYYQSLVKKAYDVDSRALSEVRKDLHRTLPNNRHFKSGGVGIEKLERVLLAYSIHNDKVGYCQSMNMIAATGLLFLDEETAFWFLVMVIEKLMPAEYYSSGLLGAVADLGVVKKLVADKLPRLNAHLQEYFVDVTLVTFSWFLTVFTDALPTESALRVLDCYLLEGHKLLFRVSLAILKVNEQHILNISEQTSILVYLKEITKHTFHVEELLHVAFSQLNPFPRRSQLASWHHANFVVVKKEWNKKEMKRQAFKQQKQQQQLQNLNLLASIALGSSTESASTVRHLQWNCGCLRQRNEAWICCDEKGHGRLGVVSLDDANNHHLDITSCQVMSSATAIYHEPSSDILLVGSLDFVLQAFDCKQRNLVWSHKFQDSILDIAGTESGKIIVGLANGAISIFKNVDKPCVEDDFWHLYIDSNSVAALVIPIRETVWCGAGKTITVVSLDTFEPVHTLTVNGNISKMRSGLQGVWISFRSSTKLCLYHSATHIKLFEVDYTTMLPPPAIINSSESRLISKCRVISLLVDSEVLYIGNGGGEVVQFRIVATVADPEATIRALANERGKPKAELRRSRIEESTTEEHGGLLTKSLLSTGREDEHSEEPSYFATGGRRRTAGRSLHHGRPKTEANQISIYKLEFMTSQRLGSTINESITFILPIREQILVSVNRALEWGKCLAVLYFNQQEQSKPDCSPSTQEQLSTAAKERPVVKYVSPP